MFCQIPSIDQSRFLSRLREKVDVRSNRQNCQPHNTAVDRNRGEGISTDCAEAQRLNQARGILCQALEPRHGHERQEDMLHDSRLLEGLPDIRA
jgi:hypothetical protein